MNSEEVKELKEQIKELQRKLAKMEKEPKVHEFIEENKQLDNAIKRN